MPADCSVSLFDPVAQGRPKQRGHWPILAYSCEHVLMSGGPWLTCGQDS